MVLPWVTDHQSKPFRSDLLGCPYFDAENDDIVFAVDKGYSLNLTQSAFSKLKRPVMEFHVNSKKTTEESENIKSLRKEFQDTFVPTSLLKTCLNELDLDENDAEFRNKLLFRKNPYLSDQFIAIYPDISGRKLVIDYLNESETEKHGSSLNAFDTTNIEFCFPIRSLKSNRDNIFAAASNQTIRLYSIEKESINEIFEFIAPEDDYFSSFDVSRNDPQICAILKKNRRLTFFNGTSSQSYELSDDFIDCACTLHPSLVALSGYINRIELKDMRYTFPGYCISDRHAPFHSVQALVPHEHDSNLIAISCKTDSYDHSNNNYAPVSELRIYDFRYPKESIMRVATDFPIVQFVTFDSFIQENTDHLIGLDSSSNVINWEFRHSKSNIEHSDGILSLAHCCKIGSKEKCDFSENRNFIGYSASTSFVHDESFFITRLSDAGEVDYCKIYKNGSGDLNSDIYSFSEGEEMAEVINFTNLSQIYAQRTKFAGIKPKSLCENFVPMCQSTFHLDFYWDELKEQIYQDSI